MRFNDDGLITRKWLKLTKIIPGEIILKIIPVSHVISCYYPHGFENSNQTAVQFPANENREK